MELGEAWDALARLDLDRGMGLFANLALRYPECSEARDGLAIARHWQPLVAAIRSLSPGDAAAALWHHMRQHDTMDRLATPRLRRALTEHLVALLVAAELAVIPPDLARGALLLALDRCDAAVVELRAARLAHPDEPVILFNLAEAQWRLGHHAAARAVWARLMLVAPEVAPGPSVPADLLTVIQRFSTAWAPHYGWLENVLPLVAPAPHLPTNDPRAAYAALVTAETARRRSDHDGMVAARLRLRELAGDLLDAYLQRLDSGD